MSDILTPPPAPAAPAVPAAPAEPALNPIQAAIEEAREQLAGATLATPATDSATPAPAAAPGDGTQEQPRGADGRFAKPDAAAPADPNAPVDPNAPAAAAEGESDDEDAGDEPYVFSVAQDGAEPIEVELAGLPPEVIAELDRLQTNGMRAVDYHTQVADLDRDRAERQEFEDELAANPVGVLLDHVPHAVRLEVVRALLAQDDKLYAAINDELLGWDEDPTARPATARTLAQQLDERATAVRTNLAADRTARTAAQAVWKGVLELVPAGARDEDASDFLHDSHAFLMREMQSRDITPQELPSLLARRVGRYFSGTSGAPAPLAAAAPASEDAAELARRAEAARGTGKRLVQASVRRKEAAAVAPAGAGGGPATVSIPKGTGLKAAIDMVRQRGGL